MDIDRCSRHIHGGFALFRQRRRCGSRYPWLQRKLSCELEQGVQCLWEILWSNGCFDWCVTDWIISIPLARDYSWGEASSEKLVNKLINLVLLIIQFKVYLEIFNCYCNMCENINRCRESSNQVPVYYVQDTCFIPN